MKLLGDLHRYSIPRDCSQFLRILIPPLKLVRFLREWSPQNLNRNSHPGKKHLRTPTLKISFFCFFPQIIEFFWKWSPRNINWDLQPKDIFALQPQKISFFRLFSSNYWGIFYIFYFIYLFLKEMESTKSKKRSSAQKYLRSPTQKISFFRFFPRIIEVFFYIFYFIYLFLKEMESKSK